MQKSGHLIDICHAKKYQEMEKNMKLLTSAVASTARSKMVKTAKTIYTNEDEDKDEDNAFNEVILLLHTIAKKPNQKYDVSLNATEIIPGRFITF